jgi:hypothetical protein
MTLWYPSTELCHLVADQIRNRLVGLPAGQLGERAVSMRALDTAAEALRGLKGSG